MAKSGRACAYKHCLHDGLEVKASEAVKDGNKYYHMDCLLLKKTIDECLDTYLKCAKIDKLDYKKVCPVVMRILNYLIFHDKIPAEFILKNLKLSKNYYIGKSPQVLYGLRKLFWEKEFQA